MPIKVWPFLISRNRYVDYRAVVVPDFISSAGVDAVISRAADGDTKGTSTVFVREIKGTSVGTFSIAFRIVPAAVAYIETSSSSEDILKDQFGREIYLIEGIVVKEPTTSIAFVDPNVLERVHQQNSSGFQHFWAQTDPSPAIAKPEFWADNSSGNTKLELVELAPFQASSREEPPKSNSNLQRSTREKKLETGSTGLLGGAISLWQSIPKKIRAAFLLFLSGILVGGMLFGGRKMHVEEKVISVNDSAVLSEILTKHSKESRKSSVLVSGVLQQSTDTDFSLSSTSDCLSVKDGNVTIAMAPIEVVNESIGAIALRGNLRLLTITPKPQGTRLLCQEPERL